jgi:hypothetical protein
LDHESEAVKNNRLIEDIKNNFDHGDKNRRGALDGDKVRLATSFTGAFYHFTEGEVSKQSLAKSLVIALNTLTKGDYHLLRTFYELEMRISRKMYFLELAYTSFVPKELSGRPDDPDVINVFDDLKKLFNFEFSDFYIQTSFLSTVDICEHTLKIDRAQYLTLSKILGIAVNQDLFQEWRNGGVRHRVYMEDYTEELAKKMGERLMAASWREDLKESFGHNMEIVTFKDEE